MLMSRCSLEKPSSEERCLRTTSPSRIVTGRPPISSSFTSSTLAMVDLPEPDRPVKNTVKPCLWRGGGLLWGSLTVVGEGEPLGQVAALVEALAKLGAGDVENPGALGHLVLGHVGGLVLDVDHHL